MNPHRPISPWFPRLVSRHDRPLAWRRGRRSETRFSVPPCRREGLLSWFLILVLACAPAMVLAAVEATVDRTVVGEGESLELRLKVTGDDAGATPDMAPLERDFEVAGTRRSSHIRFINGRMERSKSWILTLIPKGTGELSIPALDVGDATTRPLTVSVRPAGSGPADDEPADVFLEVEAEPRNPYVQAQVSYRVRIFFQDLSEGELANPEVEGAVVARHGEDVAYDATRHGRRYRVLERRYVIFPQRSGPLEIPAPVFVGRAPDGGAGPRSPFGSFGAFDQMFQSARAIRRRGEAVTLEVRPQPAAFQGKRWLPAQALALDQEWSDGAGTGRVGEPITRALIIEARGLEAAQLPELGPPAGAGYRAYADKPQLETGADGAPVVSRRRESHAIIPTRPGELRLPPVEVHWWNTRDDTPQLATLPGRTIKVQPAAGEAPKATAPAEPRPAPATPAPSPPGDPSRPGLSAGPWPWISALLLGAWLVTLYLLVRQRRRVVSPATVEGPVQPSGAPTVSEATKSLVRACRGQNPLAARDALLVWGRARWPEDPPVNLGQLAARVGPGELADLVTELDPALYGGPASPAPSAELWERLPGLVRAWRPRPEGDPAALPLPELYPGSHFYGHGAE
ncbi:MAG: BatD family protein [Gammaproteobacteria bacterium]|nr:BatD family protein [Gammaproteobacteria bacterium]